MKKEGKTCEANEKICHGCHTHEKQEEENTKLEISLYIISAILFLLSFMPAVASCRVYLQIATILLAGYQLLYRGIKNLLHLRFEEDTLMTIAVIAAFLLGEYPESCMVVLLFHLGEFLEERAVEKSNQHIKGIAKIKAKTANRLLAGEIELVGVEEIKVGETILIKPGEMVPLDGEIIEGESTLDTANITGESKPLYVQKGNKIVSGTVNLTGSLTVKVEKDVAHSTASQMIDLVYEATNNKGKTEAFITKFSKIYTPIVIIIAVVVAIFPPLLQIGAWKEWIMRALVFLVASCPCSIVISVPLAFFSCVGAISKKGMLIKGTKHIENLAKAEYIALDKTGTITTGKMKVKEIQYVEEERKEEILAILYEIEKKSNHPISTAIMQYVEKEKLELNKVIQKQEEIAGHGIYAIMDGKEILFGNEKLCNRYHVTVENKKQEASYFCIDKKIIAYVTFEEEVREDCKEMTQIFNKEKVIMLTGDNEKNAQKIAKQVGITQVYAGLLPQQKLEKVKQYKEKGNIIFVGDGMNDGPVLAEADFGISMANATEIANQTADGILLSNRISTLPSMMKIAKKTMQIVKGNIVFSLIVKMIVLTMGIKGMAPIWLAIVADTGVSLLTVLNTIRIFYRNKLS